MSNNHIVSINMTNFFNRELMMYAFGDIKFKKPISLKAVAYTLAFLIVWVGPLFFIFGIPTNPVALILYLVPPIVLGQLAIRPIFGGKTLIDFTKTAIMFIGEPRGWADMRPFDPNPKAQLFTTEHEIWISRRRELAQLADSIQEEYRQAQPPAKVKSKSKKKKK